MKIEQLNGKPVTVVYLIEDAAEWEKTNPLNYRHHGLKAYGCAASDLMERCDRLERGLRIIANMEKDPDRFATDEQIAKHYLEDVRVAPNDPKLSDCGARRAGCVVGERRRPEAASVTRGAVRCSAWFGVAGVGKWCRMKGSLRR